MRIINYTIQLKQLAALPEKESFGISNQFAIKVVTTNLYLFSLG